MPSGLDTGKPATTIHYDALDREIRKGSQRFNGQWQLVDRVYDQRGRLEKVSLPFRGETASHWNTYSYDAYNRPVGLTEASGKTSAWHYGRLWTMETKDGITTTRTFDQLGAVVKVEDPGGIITYEIRPDGQPSRIVAPGNAVTSFSYDNFGRRLIIDDPSAGKQYFSESYASDGSRTFLTREPNGHMITSKYDKYGRLLESKRDELNTEYRYNADGDLSTVKSNNGTAVSYTYDAYGRIATARTDVPDGVFLSKSYKYADGNLASIQYTSQKGGICTENYVYANGHNTEVKLNNTTSIWKLTEENGLGQPTKAVTGALARTYSYDAFGLPTGRTAGNIQSFSFQFNAKIGSLSSRKDNRRNLEETFVYDNLNRLQVMTGKGIDFDEKGNLTVMPNAGTLGYGNSSRPYQVTAFTPSSPTVTPREQHLHYNSFQRPDSIVENGITATLVYNTDGNRVKMKVVQGNQELLTRYYIDDEYELDGPKGVERLYLYGDAYDAPAVYIKEGGAWKLYYICRDYQGSITHIANADGTLKQELSYDAWGRLRNPQSQTIYEQGKEPELFLGRGYTGHEHLRWFGLINMNARLYDPVLGRFLSPDPYVQMPDFTQSFNRYSYCLNNPLKYVDRDGKSLLLIVAAIAGAYIGGVASNKGELNPIAWDWKEFSTYLGIGFGAILGYSCAYGLLNPGTFSFTFGINNAWGIAGLTVGGAGCLSNWNFHWTTIAGDGGNIPLPGESYVAEKNSKDERFFHGTSYDASRVLVMSSKLKGVEMAKYKTYYGYYFEQSEGYVFSSNKIDNARYRYIGTRANGHYIYYVSNTINAGTLFRIRTRNIEGKSKPYLALDLDQQFEVLEIDHTHPNNAFLSKDDPFQDVIPTHAIGWDGHKYGALEEFNGGSMLPEVEIRRPTIK
uniref:Teneurin-like YD-shell domain-containing protein n=1 Tax=Prevotella sp. GTC17260 TaxID=3236796 RepID=A0AB33J9L8_9BACT